nr:MAG TPA: hypothetical protein [Caudoviricetes sp.]
MNRILKQLKDFLILAMLHSHILKIDLSGRLNSQDC